MQHNKHTGIFYLLNEYGDMTAAEYEQLVQQEGRNNNTNRKNDDTTKHHPISTTRLRRDDGPSSSSLTGVAVVEALAKTAQEYQEFLNRSGRGRNGGGGGGGGDYRSNASIGGRRNEPKPKPSSGGAGERNHRSDYAESDRKERLDFQKEQENETEKVVVQETVQFDEEFIKGITSRAEDQQETFRATPSQTNPPPPPRMEAKVSAPKRRSKGVAVEAELIIDPPPSTRTDEEEELATPDVSAPRVKPPPRFESNTEARNRGMANHDPWRDAMPPPPPKVDPLESMYYSTFTQKSYFTGGIGTQVVGISSKRRLVRWTPDMDV
jgi:hypothetical protein